MKRQIIHFLISVGGLLLNMWQSEGGSLLRIDFQKGSWPSPLNSTFFILLILSWIWSQFPKVLWGPGLGVPLGSHDSVFYGLSLDVCFLQVKKEGATLWLQVGTEGMWFSETLARVQARGQLGGSTFLKTPSLVSLLWVLTTSCSTRMSGGSSLWAGKSPCANAQGQESVCIQGRARRQVWLA